MSKNANIIELNGKRYDALTGALLEDATPAPAVPSAPATAKASPNAIRFIDGFVRPAHTADLTPQPAKPHTDIVRPGPNSIPHRVPSRSQTLMRNAVSRPDASFKRTINVVGNTQALVGQPEIKVAPKLSHPHVDPIKRERAAQIPRSEQISRYAVRLPETPAEVPALTPIAAPAVAERPAINQTVTQARPVPVNTPAVTSPAQAPVAAGSMDVFERALQRANSHQEKTATPEPNEAKHSFFRHRFVGFGAAAAAVLVLGGFIAYQNQTNISMHYAASKAGIAASLPGSSPKGYEAGRLTYSSGLVAVSYKNPNSGQGFNLIQRQSNWDSDALREDFVADQSKYYNTIEAAGRTIYTYGDNNATWVNGGIWYRIDSPGGLTTDQIVKLATSI